MAMTANVVAKCAGRTAPTSDRAHLATPQALNKNVIGSCLVEDHAHDLVRRALAQYGNHVFGMLDLCVPAPNQHCVGGRVERIAVRQPAGCRLPKSSCREKWSERGGLNSRPPVPQTGMLCFSNPSPSLYAPHSLYLSRSPRKSPQNA